MINITLFHTKGIFLCVIILWMHIFLLITYHMIFDNYSVDHFPGLLHTVPGLMACLQLKWMLKGQNKP